MNTANSLVSIGEIAHEVAGAMIRVTVEGQAARISTPLLYPGGSMIGVEIARHRDGFLVSDMGGACREADLSGGARQFARIANEVAKQFGVRFDHNMIFDVEVPDNELVIAVMAVANAAKSAVEATMMQQATNEHIDLIGMLWARLDRVFGHEIVQRRLKFQGSAVEWRFDAAVVRGGRISLFEAIAAHPNAVSSAVTKFLDIKDLGESAPARFAVLSGNPQDTPHLAVLARVAHVVKYDADDGAFLQAA